MFLNYIRSLNVVKKRLVYSIHSNIKYKIKMKSYTEAVNCINLLQTNKAYIDNATSNNNTHNSTKKLVDFQKYLTRSGITLNDLDKLSIIHVAGTKGKGSTCAFCENILRLYGYKTGFYSSPHLVAVRERIKLNGKPLSEDAFAENFFKIYNKLMDAREYENDMPMYFAFLTILAFNIFLAEKLDVIILEVGIGGEFDCTNIIRNTPIVGITSLGLDHTSLLGNTIEEIAWQKGGIMKNNSKVFTVEQKDTAMNVLIKRSKERNCNLQIVPKFENYIWQSDAPVLGVNGNIQTSNASLAVQLSHAWITYCASRKNGLNYVENNLMIPENTKIGLESCKWPGRYQILKKLPHTFYLDGAHTIESLKICIEWFKTVVNRNSKKVLIFNLTGNRNSEQILQLLSKIDFNYVMFVPNKATYNIIPVVTDQQNLINSKDSQIKQCENHKNIWLKIQNNSSNNVDVFSCVLQAVENIPKDQVTDILITGSLHLIGAALTILDPDLKSF